MIEIFIPYIPTILTAIITGIVGILMKSLSSKTELMNVNQGKFINILKSSYAQMVKDREDIDSRVADYERKYEELLEQAQENEQKFNERLLALEQESKEVVNALSAVSKQYVNVEAAMRREDNNDSNH